MSVLGRLLRNGAIAVVMAAMLTGAAVANDIKTFNSAVRAGDYKAAAAAAEQVWKTWDKSDPDTALLAREFGFAALVSGRNDLALQFGKFLVEQGAALPTADDQPLTSAVLYRAANFKLNNGQRERSALREALVARMDAPGADMTTALSWELLYAADNEVGDWDNSIADANTAAQFLSRSRGLLVLQRKAELHAVSSEFAKARGRQTQSRNDLYDLVADVHDRIVADIDAATSQAQQNEFWPVKWRAEAWAIAVESYINSSYEQVGSNIRTALTPRSLRQPQYAPHPEVSPMPVCEGSFEGTRLHYPNSKRFQGVGSMIVRLETGSNGKVIDAEILGAIPNEEFIEGLVATMKTWTYTPAMGVDRATCTLSFRNYLYKGSFRIL